ncbi:hypothetical protein LINPERPRIM_LOCUS36050 [Linum perenne]
MLQLHVLYNRAGNRRTKVEIGFNGKRSQFFRTNQDGIYSLQQHNQALNQFHRQLTGMSVFMPMHVTALCSNPVNWYDVSSGASLTA